MSYTEDLVKNYKARQKAIKKMKEEYKEIFKPMFKMHKDSIVQSYAKGDNGYEIALTTEQTEALKNLLDTYWKYKDEIFREILEEEEIAVVVYFFDTWYIEENMSKIKIFFSQQTKKELDKELKENKI